MEKCMHIYSIPDSPPYVTPYVCVFSLTCTECRHWKMATDFHSTTKHSRGWNYVVTDTAHTQSVIPVELAKHFEQVKRKTNSSMHTVQWKWNDNVLTLITSKLIQGVFLLIPHSQHASVERYNNKCSKIPLGWVIKTSNIYFRIFHYSN